MGWNHQLAMYIEVWWYERNKCFFVIIIIVLILILILIVIAIVIVIVIVVIIIIIIVIVIVVIVIFWIIMPSSSSSSSSLSSSSIIIFIIIITIIGHHHHHHHPHPAYWATRLAPSNGHTHTYPTQTSSSQKLGRKTRLRCQSFAFEIMRQFVKRSGAQTTCWGCRLCKTVIFCNTVVTCLVLYFLEEGEAKEVGGWWVCEGE